MKKYPKILAAMLFLILSCADEDVFIIGDFEDGTFGQWRVEGDAFGEVPASGSLPGQDKVKGYKGKGLANSFVKGNEATGTLTSPEFGIKYEYLNFLIGGGSTEGTRFDILDGDGELIRTIATGNNSATLEWVSVDTWDLIGNWVKLQIVDESTGEWGHILVDHIYWSRTPKVKIPIVPAQSRSWVCKDRYLNLPVSYEAKSRIASIFVDGEKIREIKIQLAEEDPDFWVFIDIKEFKGEEITVRLERFGDKPSLGLEIAHQGNTYPGEENNYKERLRPQIHYTSKRGWNNDTNGLVYYDGEYHLFYQHNPYGWHGANTSWGHAVSTDMLHWEELGDAIYPDELGYIFSGSAVVDYNNSSGLQTGDEAPILCFYTAVGPESPWSVGEPVTQCLAYSNDRGRTFTKYDGNPIIGEIRGESRDPKVIWHEPTQKWVLMLYVEQEEMDIFFSDNLTDWTHASRLQGFHECPELFELAVDGDESNKKWVTYGASAAYAVGSFDGLTFTPAGDTHKFNYGNAFYASQTFSDMPEEDGRKIMMGWGRVPMPGMPFNQMVTFPVNLTLRTTDDGIRMFGEPVDEIKGLHKKRHSMTGKTIGGTKVLPGVEGELFHITAEFQIGKAELFGITVREFDIKYDAAAGQIICEGPDNDFGPESFSEPVSVQLDPEDGVVRVEIIVDRTLVEVFVDDGRYYLPLGTYLVDKDPAVKVYSVNGKTKLNEFEVYELSSIWE
jgi:fructan beta-fructosidase